MGASGSMISRPLASVEAVNLTALASAQTAYELMRKILGDDQAALIFAALPINAAAIGAGLLAYEQTLADSALIYRRIGLEPPGQR